MIWIYSIVAILVLGIGVYVWIFYPQQLIDPKTILPVEVTTPEPEKYHNDVLHPCIRKMSNGKYVMVQSPWYKCQDGIENPILYISDDPMYWDNGIVVEDTPAKGYNSDPNVFVEGNRIYVFWREWHTPFCEEHGVLRAIVGVYTEDEGLSFSNKRIYFTDNDRKAVNEICPILIKRGEIYRFYCTWYSMHPRQNEGVAIWEGSSIEEPDFKLIKRTPFKTKYICDKYKQLQIFGKNIFLPMPHKFDLWHFDLLEKDGTLYMIASEEMKDVVMIAESDDWENFKLHRKPLINAHSMENTLGYRQSYYKPTAIKYGKRVMLFITANPKENGYAHNLFMTEMNII